MLLAVWDQLHYNVYIELWRYRADYLYVPSPLRNLRSSLHGQIILNLCFALLGLYLFFLIAAHVTTVPGLCGLVSALLHYFILVFFAWTAAEAVYLYIKLVKVMEVDKYIRGYTWKAGLPAWSKWLCKQCLTNYGFNEDKSSPYGSCSGYNCPNFFGRTQILH